MQDGITIIEQVKEIAERSGVPLEIDVTKLSTLAVRGKAIKDVNDENFVAVKKEMQKTRTELTSYFMDARRGFNKLAEGVRDVEKAVLGEFTPEEDRLIALDKAEKERLLKEARLEALPAKRERITNAGIEFADVEILSRSDADFEIEYNSRLGAKLEADRLVDQQKREEAEAKLEEERQALQREKEAAEAVEQARQEERERAAEELRLEKERNEREAKEAAERAEREKAESETRRLREIKEAEDRRIAEEKERVAKAEREAKEAADKKEREDRETKEAEVKRQATKKFQDFLTKNNFNDDTDIILDGKNLYRFVAQFKA